MNPKLLGICHVSFEAARLEKEWIATLAQTEFRLPIYIAAPTQRLFAASKRRATGAISQQGRGVGSLIALRTVA